MLLRLFVVLVLVSLSGCRVYMAGYLDDWSDVIVGEGDVDPISQTGTGTARFEKSGITCTGVFTPSQKPGKRSGQQTGRFTCSDGRRVETESFPMDMSSGVGTGRDELGYTAQWSFHTSAEPMQVLAENYRREVASRNVSNAAFVAKVPRGQQVPSSVAILPPVGAAPVAIPSAVPAIGTGNAVAPSTAPTSSGSALPASGTTQRVALVIGNSSYKDAPLRNPVNDARLMAARLREVGFEVMLVENGLQRDINRALTRFGERLNSQTIGLFFYAGHGMQVKGRNFLLPVDAVITTEASVRNESIDVDQVLEQMSASGSLLNLVILDACRNNPFERRFRGSSGGLAQIDAPKGTLIAFSTAPGKVAADGEGANSAYTEALAKAMTEPGAPVETVFKRVRNEVSRTSRDQQIPWEASSLTGDFYFVSSVRQ